MRRRSAAARSRPRAGSGSPRRRGADACAGGSAPRRGRSRSCRSRTARGSGSRRRGCWSWTKRPAVSSTRPRRPAVVDFRRGQGRHGEVAAVGRAGRPRGHGAGSKPSRKIRSGAKRWANTPRPSPSWLVAGHTATNRPLPSTATPAGSGCPSRTCYGNSVPSGAPCASKCRPKRPSPCRPATRWPTRPRIDSPASTAMAARDWWPVVYALTRNSPPAWRRWRRTAGRRCRRRRRPGRAAPDRREAAAGCGPYGARLGARRVGVEPELATERRDRR